MPSRKVVTEEEERGKRRENRELSRGNSIRIVMVFGHAWSYPRDRRGGEFSRSQV